MTASQRWSRPEQRPAWGQLQTLAQSHPLHLRQLLSTPGREFDGCVSGAGLELDFTHQRVDAKVFHALAQLVEQSRLTEHIHALFRGEAVNTTEGRPALHMALRGSADGAAPWGETVSSLVSHERERFLAFAERARGGHWLGFNGSPITDVVNLGIGGSDLGPRMATHALTTAGVGAAKTRLRVHFVSNVDASAMSSVLAALNPASTAFVVQSKTLTTQETLLLAQSARRWLTDGGCPLAEHTRHMVAVTARADLALEQGFDPAQTFLFWDWVGGRYSVWSAIGLPLALAIGADEFRRFLQGGSDMDTHFLTTPFARNLPMLAALLGVWNSNFLGASSLNIAPYAYALMHFVPFVQQLDMESNGKSTHLDGSPAGVQTGPIIWGGLGINGQHAYYQLIHQGSHLVPVDFIGVRRCHDNLPDAQQHHQMVLNNLKAQARAMALGRDEAQTRLALLAEGLSESQADRLGAHRTYAGNNPSSTLWLPSINAHSMGALVALYEHKVFCQSVIWGINPFDQWGVELGKTMLREFDSPR
jgi:glucose-6-phosphate isomerase